LTVTAMCFLSWKHILNPLDKKHEEGLLHDILTLFLGNYHSDCAILLRRIYIYKTGFC
jgi:hypothetical protein